MVPYTVILFAIPAMLSGIMSLVGVRSSDPPTPPSGSAAAKDDQLTFWAGAITFLLGSV